MDQTPQEKIYFAPFQITAVNTDPAMYLSYKGPQIYGEVSVNASGDIILEHGASSSVEVADGSLGLPISDETTGIIDVSDAEANTYGEIYDYINTKTNWKCRLGGVRRADIANDSLLLKAETEVTRDSETPLYKDGDTAVQATTWSIGVRVTNNRAFMTPSLFSGECIGIDAIQATVTFTVGTGTGYDDGEGALNGCRIIVYAVNDDLKTQRRLYYSPATLTSNTLKSLTTADWGGQPLQGGPGEDLLVIVQNSGTTGSPTKLTAPTIIVGGYRFIGGVSRVQKSYRESNW